MCLEDCLFIYRGSSVIEPTLIQLVKQVYFLSCCLSLKKLQIALITFLPSFGRICPTFTCVHVLWKCRRFLGRSTQERWNFRKGNCLCFNCLGVDHVRAIVDASQNVKLALALTIPLCIKILYNVRRSYRVVANAIRQIRKVRLQTQLSRILSIPEVTKYV